MPQAVLYMVRLRFPETETAAICRLALSIMSVVLLQVESCYLI